MSYVPSAGSVLFDHSEQEAVVHVNVEPDVFLAYGASFTVTLTDVSFIGVEGGLGGGGGCVCYVCAKVCGLGVEGFCVCVLGC